MIEVSYKSQNSGIQASLRLLFWVFMNKMRYLSRLRWREIEARCCCRVQTGSLDIDVVHCSLCVPEIHQVRVWVSNNELCNAPRGHICLLLDLDGALSHPPSRAPFGERSLAGGQAPRALCFRPDIVMRRTGEPLCFPTVNGFSMCYKCFFLLWTNLIAPHIILDHQTEPLSFTYFSIAFFQFCLLKSDPRYF